MRLLWMTAALLVGSLTPSFLVSATSTDIDATVKVTVCGDEIVESPEQCEGADLDGASCASLGYAGGSLSCLPSCEFDTSACIPGSEEPEEEEPVPSVGAGGGGGSGVILIPAPSSVLFSGRAYPGSTVTLLKDAQLAASTVAGSDARFSIQLSGLSSGSYLFSVYTEDLHSVRSSPLIFPVTVTLGTTIHVTGIYLAPSIFADKREVRYGDTISFFGQAAPGASVTTLIHSETPFLVQTLADEDGTYLSQFGTSVLEIGAHTAKSQSSLQNEVTPFGGVVAFTVGALNVPAEPPDFVPKKEDINQDHRVNLVDFSIIAYWYRRADPPPSVDLNDDGKVDLTDLSILAFHWTG